MKIYQARFEFIFGQSDIFLTPLVESRPRRLLHIPDLDLNRLANRPRRLHQRIELNRDIVRIEHTIQLRAAGCHHLGHLHFGDVGSLHAFFNLFGQSSLERLGLHFFEHAFVFEEVIEV